MSDMIKQAEERREKEQKEKEKARKKALRGVIGLAKQVWREMPMGPNVFE